MYRATQDSASQFRFLITRLSLSLACLSNTSSNLLCTVSLSYNPNQSCRLVWALSRSLAATEEIIVYFLFLQLLRCFNSLSSLALVYVFNQPYIGLPHSETFGSKLASSSPKRIVGNHVLLRLPVPRYPP